MSKEHNHIDSFFKEAVSEFSMEVKQEAWLQLAPKVNRLKFWKPGISHFNVIYASLIAGTFFISSIVGADYFISKTSNDAPQLEIIPAIEDSAKKEKNLQPDTIVIYKTKQNKVKQNKPVEVSSPQPKNTSELSQIKKEVDPEETDNIIGEKKNNGTDTLLSDTLVQIIQVKPPPVIKLDTHYQQSKKRGFNRIFGFD